MKRLVSSTRGRLVISAVGVFAIALLVSDGIVFASLVTSQTQQADDVLVAQANLLGSSIQDSNGQLSFDGSDIETQTGIAVDAAIVVAQKVTAQTPNQPLSTSRLFQLSSQAIASGHPVFATVDDVHHVPRRVYAVPISGSRPAEVLVVSRAVAEMLAIQGRTFLSLVVVSIALLIMGGLLAYWLAGRALRPVRTIAGTARSISEHDLGKRVEVKVPPDELGELVTTFNEMLARLEAAFASMSRFTADASHELRAPLALMRSEIDRALNRARSKDEYRQTLVGLQGEIDHLARMADQLLILARADAGTLAPARQKIDVADFVHETGARWEPAAERKGVRIEVEAPSSGYVSADPALLRRVMDNLLDNAVRFTHEGTSVSLSAYQQNAGWNIDVADHGPGVPGAFRSSLFGRFSRSDAARSREDGGAGLGLALSRAIVLVHGGTLDVVDRRDAGAVFRIHLPSGHV